AHSLIAHPDVKLENQLDALIDLMALAQQADGYLNSHFIVVRPHMRWTNLRDWHELYCAGHLIEAAVAHFVATGKDKFLNLVRRYADLIEATFGREPGKKRGYPGHEEIELALVKLYHATGEKRYLHLAKYFVDERGTQPHYFDLEARARGEDPADYWAKTHEYTQSHLPVREQSVPVGHAVRGTYLYAAMADLAAEYNDESLFDAARRIWQHLVQKRMYITGGIGSSRHNEGYTVDYDLPNESAYAETCASIGLIFWAWRMLQLEPQRTYADVLERALYNGTLSGISLAGDTFFYENPLESQGNHHRKPWHTCACCPPNIARLLASLGQFIYAANEDEVYTHLYIGSKARFEIQGHQVELAQTTRYPWQEQVQVSLEVERPTTFTLAFRLPEWCPSPQIRVNGKRRKLEALPEHGYAKIHRQWRDGDRVDLFFQMPIHRMQAHPRVRANCGRIALQRGPLIYCIEQADHGENLNDIYLRAESRLMPHFEADLLGGVVAIYGHARQRRLADWAFTLYKPGPAVEENTRLKAIPYFAWDNREPGEMLVWIREC
ncbi:MAG: glycoside hydrolase family 127 protein, partial [Calditrichaeota bacterium]